MMTLFVFAILGHTFFRGVPLASSFGGINSLYNFQDFHHAFLSVLFWSSGFDWEQALEQTMAHAGGVAALYWVLFVGLTQYVIFQLFMLAMIDVFQTNYVAEFNPKTLFAEMEEDFVDRWVKLSDFGKGLRMK